MEYALLQMGQEQRTKQIRDDSNAIKKLGFEFLPSYTALAAVPARFALERQRWKEAAARPISVMKSRRLMVIPRGQNEPSYPFKATFWKGSGTAVPVRPSTVRFSFNCRHHVALP
jgi:hypothetical protein